MLIRLLCDLTYLSECYIIIIITSTHTIFPFIQISEDAEIGTFVHALIAYNPNNETSEALDYSAGEPITAVDKDGKEVNNTENFKDLFRVDSTGKVYVSKPLKRDTFAVIRTTVVVRNKSAPTIPEGKGLLIITIIDVNEFPPVSRQCLSFMLDPLKNELCMKNQFRHKAK